mmetsp:Transcript_9991/g.21486  ORF Transcript_9991/g.21486 Transcript_9991/m.21486 type:complete len:220 (+) Transcript_9991:3516-4175(+)
MERAAGPVDKGTDSGVRGVLLVAGRMVVRMRVIVGRIGAHGIGSSHSNSRMAVIVGMGVRTGHGGGLHKLAVVVDGTGHGHAVPLCHPQNGRQGNLSVGGFQNRGGRSRVQGLDQFLQAVQFGIAIAIAIAISIAITIAVTVVFLQQVALVQQHDVRGFRLSHQQVGDPVGIGGGLSAVAHNGLQEVRRDVLHPLLHFFPNVVVLVVALLDPKQLGGFL